MAIHIGAMVGAFEIIALEGAGGMGEVYRARDSRLGRSVALKVLPDRFHAHADRLARFTREAQLLASLNHPNIATIHGIENVQARQLLVLELVEGETLADRIARGRLPVDEALHLALQIAAGLEAAHQCGVVHLDLKPSNIMVRTDGALKILDFGLAKALDAAEPAAGTAPTMTAQTAHGGVLLGTAAYMSPEQARGQAADRRADIWAFGAVLFEMLAGKPAFRGDTVIEQLAAVMKEQPPWAELPDATPRRIRVLLRRCLQRDPRQRLQAIGDARIEIEDAPADAVEPQGRKSSSWRSIAAMLAGVLVAGGGSVLWFRGGSTPLSRVTRLSFSTDSMVVNTGDRAMAIARDGSRVAYIDANRLMIRAMDTLDAVPISVGRNMRGPFFAPSGSWVGFVTSVNGVSQLAKVSITGGPAVPLCSLDGTPRGATWRNDGTIVFASANTTTGLWRVPEAGGTPTALTRPDATRGELDHLWPEVLPDGQSVLFTISPTSGDAADTSVAVLNGQTGEQRILVRGGSDAHYVSSGHLVYAVGKTLRAVGFDASRLRVTSSPVPLPLDVITLGPGGHSYFDVAADGTLLYARRASTAPRHLVWVDRSAHEQPINAAAHAFRHPRISPDGKRIAIDANDDEEDIWIWDVAAETLNRFTAGSSAETGPVWSAHGSHLIFQSNRGGGRNIYWQRADGAGPIERLTHGPKPQWPTSVSPDGSTLVVTESGGATPDLMLLRLPSEHSWSAGQRAGEPAFLRAPGPADAGDRESSSALEPLLQTPDNDQAGEISPDGRWLAYVSYKSGRGEIYVKPYPDVGGGEWRISTGGGKGPLWRRDSQELFYADFSGALLGVRVTGKDWDWTTVTPTTLLPPRYFVGLAESYRTYDVSPDGKRFLMVAQGAGTTDADQLTLIVVQHWSEELKRVALAQ